jgi:Pyruvate/2-oxoacid:ferredoxin oxidoreductase gamma subunit
MPMSDRMQKEIKICGFGGQGIILAGVILGEAAVKAGYWAVQTQSYGPEARGGPTFLSRWRNLPTIGT